MFQTVTRFAAVAAGLALVSVAMAADWPMFAGDGDRTPPVEGVELVDHLDDAPMIWEFERHTTVGKGLYPGQLKRAREQGIVPFYGGATSPIVADGVLFANYFKPNGKVPAKREGWRTMYEEEKWDLLPDWFWSVTADDILLAIDAETGELEWQAVEKNKGLNRLGHKRGHWCISPAWADGRVFSMGSAGRLYAYNAESGEKLWEVVAEPRLQKLRAEHIEKKKLCWDSHEGSSLVAVEDVVVVPHGGLTAFDVKTGDQRWQIRENVLAKTATPAIWRHKGREYLVVKQGRGPARLIDAGSGDVLWKTEGLGNQLGTVTVTDDLMIVNVGSEKATDEKNNGLFGAYKISLDGAKKLWTLPDETKYRHSWTYDRGAERRSAVRGGVVTFVVGAGKTDYLVVADAKTGKVLFEEATRVHAPYPIENRLMLWADRAHTDPVTTQYWSIENPAKPAKLHGTVGFGPRTTTAYYTPIQYPFVDGVLYLRTFGGFVAFDLRKPPPTPGNRTLHMFVPGDLLGRGSTTHVTLTQRDGALTHGGWRGARRLHSVDTSDAGWDGKRLTGTLGIDVNGYRQFGVYDVDATLGEDATLRGTITKRIDGFENPVDLKGKVTAIQRQPAWMPPATHVLQLEDAGIQEGGNKGRLLLFLTVADGKLKNVSAFADQTTQAKPIVQAEGLELKGGRVTGTVKVCYRPDKWAQPLAETGDTAAGVYTVDAKLAKEGEVGSYKGIYGVEWTETVQLLPRR